MTDPAQNALITRIAVLIDCDNVAPSHAGAVLEELATYGIPTVKRAYGDWTTTRLGGWKHELNRLAIQPVQQFSYTTGKNSTDSALIIDAMDLLWMGNVDTFALVSSDSDFTRLATRLRESGKRVIGLGERKTPASLRNAVDQFIYLELLGAGEARKPATAGEPTAGTAPSKASRKPTKAAPEEEETAPRLNLQSALVKAVNATSGDDGWANLSALGAHLSRAHVDFDPRDFGHQKLSHLVAEQPYLDHKTSGTHMLVRIKQRG